MDDLNQLFTNAIACVNSMKSSADAFINRLEGMKAASLKCDADLQEKQRLAAEQINNLRADIQHHQTEKVKAERELAHVQREIEKGRKDIERVKQEYRSTIDRILAA
jgi:predicted  nucleic acid-binding Zn-ribbon protein